MNVTINTIDILLVEDDPGDVLMTREAFEHNKVRNTLYVVTDGEQALQFLRHEAPYEDSPRPGLILLDLNLPRKDGREVLAEVKSTPALMSIPVVVLTTSEAEEDVLHGKRVLALWFAQGTVSSGKPTPLDSERIACRPTTFQATRT